MEDQFPILPVQDQPPAQLLEEDQIVLQQVQEEPLAQLLEEDPIQQAVLSPLHQEEVENPGKVQRYMKYFCFDLLLKEKI